jgi:hypothetical protein
MEDSRYIYVPVILNPGKCTVPIYGRMFRYQSKFLGWGEGETFLLLSGYERRFLNRLVHSLVTIMTEILEMGK